MLRKGINYLLLLFIVLFVLIGITLDFKTFNQLSFKFNNIEERAMKGNKEAIDKAFTFYVFKMHEYQKGEELFRKLEKNGYGKEYLAFILTLTPLKNKSRYLEGLSCFNQLAELGNEDAKLKLNKLLEENDFNITYSNLKQVQCN